MKVRGTYRRCKACQERVGSLCQDCRYCGAKVALSKWWLGVPLALGAVAWAGFATKERNEVSPLMIRSVEADGQGAFIPPSQQLFVESVDRYRKQFRSAISDEREAGVKGEREVALRELLSGCHITEWVGSVISKSDSEPGSSMIKIEVGDHIFLYGETHESINDASGGEDKGFQLERGDPVIFTGYFLPSDEGVFVFEGQSLRTSMISPEFLFHFEHIGIMSL